MPRVLAKKKINTEPREKIRPDLFVERPQEKLTRMAGLTQDAIEI